MAVTTVLFCVTFILSLIGSNATGEFTILHSPKSLSFAASSSAVTESALKEIFSACLGLSVEEELDWSGLKINNPFKSPEAAVQIYIDGVPSLGNSANLKGTKYQLVIDEYEPDTYDALAHRIKQRYVGESNTLVHVKLSNSKELASHFKVSHDTAVPKISNLNYLKYHVDEDQKFLMELQALRQVAEKVKSSVTSDNAVDFYNFRFRSLHALSDFHGPNSLQTKEAKKLLAQELEKLSAAFVKAYDGSVLVTVVTTDVAHTRRATRSLRNVDKDFYPEDYAAIFNIILWFGITFVFVMIAIVYAMVDMDPGRDSIIYRMTSTRMKKDN